VLTQRTRDLWDALQSSMKTREQPLMVGATTPGDDPLGLCTQEHDYTERILANPSLDRRRFGFIRNTPKEADWTKPANWRWANPAAGGFKSLSAMRDDCRKAQLNPAAAKRFRQYDLATWGISAVNRWVDLSVWDATAGLVRPETITGRPAYAGLDLASTTDLAAWCVTVPTVGDGGDEMGYEAVWRFWAPEARRADLDDRTGGQASVWARQGFLTFTEGDVIDYRQILVDIDVDARRFDIVEVAYDRWGMTQLTQDLGDAGLSMVPMSQGFAAMSPPTKAWEGLIRSGRYRHGGNPAMRWQFDNIRMRVDPEGNLKIDKGKSADKVDGCIAAVMALDRALRHNTGVSAYEARGLEVV